MPARTEGHRSHLSIAVAIVSIALTATLPHAAAAADPVIAAAGDIACGSTNKPTANACHQMATSNLLSPGLAAVLPLGDLQYERGAADAFASFYGPSWGRFKSISRPAVGNHEYGTAGAAGYFSFFGAAAGSPGLGYYSYDIGSWHLISLNSNCGSVRCGPGSPQLNWLRSDLAAHQSTCTLAYWHHPHFSSGPHGDGGSTDDFWTALYEGGADVVLGGHDHDYERFAPQTSQAVSDPVYGIREFVVGTGGKSHYAFSAIKPNSQVRNADTFGVLFLTLHQGSYSWRFAPEAGKTFTDAGADNCHGAPGARLVRFSAPKSVRLSRNGSFKLRARCATRCTTSFQATVAAGRRKLRSRRLSRSLPPGQQTRLTFKFSKGNRKALRKTLSRRKRLAVTIVAQAKDPAGRVTKTTLRLRLRR